MYTLMISYIQKFIAHIFYSEKHTKSLLDMTKNVDYCNHLLVRNVALHFYVISVNVRE